MTLTLHQTGLSNPEQSIAKIIIEHLGKVSEPPAPEKNNEEYQGKIVAYKFYEDKGIVETENGEKYPFDLKDITDISLKNQVKKIDSKIFDPIAVKFMLTKRAGKYVAVSVKRGAEQPKIPVTPVKSPAVYNTMSGANILFTKKDYSGALEIYRKYLDSEDWEVAFAQIIMCYLTLSKLDEDNEQGYLEELRAFVEKYIAKTTKNPKTLEALQQYYMKVHNYENAVNALNDLMECCDPFEYGRMLHYLTSKARCYRFLKDYPSAISQLLDWLDIVKRNKMKERWQQRDTLIYIELAELYFENGDFEEAEHYTGLAASSDRKQSLLEKLSAKQVDRMQTDTQSSEDIYDEEEDETDTAIFELDESLQTAYDSYTDRNDFKTLGIDDTTVLRTALGFRPDQLYCLLTYLHTAAQLSADTELQRQTDSGDVVYVGQTIHILDKAFAYACNSPFLEDAYNSTEIITVFSEAKKHIPAIAPKLFAASALYALFHTSSAPDYTFADFSVIAKEYDLEQFPALLHLINDLVSFREKTGCSMDTFAGYKTNSMAIHDIIAEAVSCCNTIDMRNEIPEKHIQSRITRELIFTSAESPLRTCLDIVAANDIEQYQFVRDTIARLFIRPNKSVTIDNLDSRKEEEYINYFWELSYKSKQCKSKNKREKILGSRNTNLKTNMQRVLSCICNWIAAAEYSHTDHVFAKEQYDAIAPQVMQELSEIIQSCTEDIANNGFDWGTESLHRAAAELLQKMDGAYTGKTRKYFFIDFLRGEDILLDDSYLPETYSTFCGIPDFNILQRIERHASASHPAFSERLSEIMSNLETKHNFRSARLIRAYGEEMQLEEITGHKDLSQYNECLKQAKQRFETLYQDFFNEMELCESYGTLSNVNGEKDEILAITYSWYRITHITNDYGFYNRLLETIRNKISVNASKKGESLLHQLDEIAGNPQYRFGVFSKEMIEDRINDQNYSAAEYIMNCILKGDTNAVADYSLDPFNHFAEFINEHATNYRAVRGAGKSIADVIFEYSGKKDLEKALIYLTNNARKETKGGANLIKGWIPQGGPTSKEQLEKLLLQLGFKPVSIQLDTSIDTEAYQVYCRKQRGKVNYAHPIPAFGSKSEKEGFRVLCLYGKYDCNSLLDKFRACNTTSKTTLVLLDFALNMEERRRLARKIKEEKSFAKPFIVIDRVI
ncbi:MAG: hypothetical protein K2H89_11680, partial [Oscillospiraceae bacterium]|nr:hypothetical protein [Oscillospiraceae bacterium]